MAPVHSCDPMNIGTGVGNRSGELVALAAVHGRVHDRAGLRREPDRVPGWPCAGVRAVTGQELAVLGLGLLAGAYVGWRFLVRRRASTCCGARQCPATQAAPPAPSESAH